MVPQILSKLTTLLNEGIKTEPQVVYLLVLIRKIIEQERSYDQYKHLNFHCNWALHASLDKKDAQEVLKTFDDVHAHYCKGGAEVDLTKDLQNKLQNISRLESFQKQLATFLQEKNLPSVTTTRIDGWPYFLHLYGKVIKDCPLVLKNESSGMNIAKVTVNIEFANQIIGGEICFRLMWEILDKKGFSGSHYVFYTFSLEPEIKLNMVSAL